MEPENEIKFRACFPLAMYALNQLYVATKVADLKREFLASANVRVAFEHAVTAQWVLYTDDAEQRLIGSMRHQNRRTLKPVLKRAQEQHLDVPAQLITEFGRGGDPSMPTFKDRCIALEGNADSLYLLYGSLSAAVHPSIATLSHHLVFDDEGVPRGIIFGAVEPPPTDMWAVGAISALAAAFTIEALREGQPQLQQVIELGVSVSLPGSLKTT